MGKGYIRAVNSGGDESFSDKETTDCILSCGFVNQKQCDRLNDPMSHEIWAELKSGRSQRPVR